ncbi:FG-GAP-like repeat-containing protein [Streptomyces sp. NBC_00879]|uniref:FG-GAP-like repeat-containing protein n=1 Tax=Streptomyces sp. NBC_00879 TaxID=2975855 RepID=UPI00386E9790|nr:FG-GAP-like repeat-containing protein [Streptomyces sp. NBC_00879]
MSAAIAIAATITSLAPMVVVPAVAAETPPAEVTIPAADRGLPRSDVLISAGSTGYLHSQEGAPGLQWTRYDGATTTFEGVTPVSTDRNGVGSDFVRLQADSTARTVRIQNMETGRIVSMTWPAGQYYLGTFGDSVLTYTRVNQVVEFHLLRDVGGTTTDRTITGLPDGAAWRAGVLAGDARSLVLPYALADETRALVVDLESGATAQAFAALGTAGASLGSLRVQLTPTSVVLPGSGQVKVVPRDEPGAAPRILPSNVFWPLAVIGDWVIGGSDGGFAPGYSPIQLRAVAPLGRTQKILDLAQNQGAVAPDGSLLVVGGTSAENWAVQRVSGAADGSLTVSRVRDVEPVTAHTGVLTLANNQLITGDNSANMSSTYQRLFRRDLALDGTLAPASRTDFGAGFYPDCHLGGEKCLLAQATGDGGVARLVWQTMDFEGVNVEREGGAGTYTLVPEGVRGRLVSTSGRYVVYNSEEPPVQSVLDTEAQKVLRTRAVVAASVWGAELWTADTAKPGRIASVDLRSGTQTEAVETGANCVPDEIQTVGRRIYWRCAAAGPAGVYDRTTAQSVAVPDGEALLGDGYLVRRANGDGLEITDLRQGGTTTQVPAQLAATESPTGRGLTWTVDRFGGGIAYVDREQRVHVRTVPGTVSPLTAIDSSTPATADARSANTYWKGTWRLSKPAASWSLTLRNSSTGAVVRTLSGSSARGRVSVTWNGKADSGAYVPDGLYNWTLAANPVDGQGAPLTVTGSVRLTGAGAARHDHAGPGGAIDGVGDLLTLSSSGVLAFQHGTRTGAFSGATSGSGWSTSAVAVPFGDLNGDRCNDVLVRIPSGELRAYKPSCGKALTPTTSYTSLGTVWNQFNVLTSPGDVTGDGRPDLVARQAATGDIYLYADNGAGGLKSRGRIGTKWVAYRAVFGAGDLNGDGIGDLLAVDKANALWRYDGTAAGTVKPRVAMFGANWGVGRNAFVGVGDITGDGKADLVSRNTAGDLLRNSGSGKGSFGSTVKIGTGWQGYKGLY